MVSPHAVHAHDNLPPDHDGAAIQLATGQFVTPVTPLAGAAQQALNPGLAAFPNFVAGEAVRAQLSPDGTTLAILCAGHNSLVDPNGNTDAANSTQYLFLFDVSGANKPKPKLSQVIKQTNAHVGLVWSPDGKTLYAAGGNDDAVYAYNNSGSGWSQTAMIALGHAGKGVGLGVQPNASGLGISADGKTLVVANNYNDSISVIDTATNTVRYEHDLRPFFANNEGKPGVAGGTFPFAVAVKGNGTAYVSSDRDREVVVLDISSSTAARLIARIKLDGNALGMTFDKAQTRLFVAQDNADQVAVIDTATNMVMARIDARAPARLLDGSRHTGAATFAVTVSPDDSTLYAVNAGANSIAVIPLRDTGSDGDDNESGAGNLGSSGDDADDNGMDGQGSGAGRQYRVAGLIPTAYEPHDITFSADGTWMYIVNGKSVTGPNQGHLTSSTANLTSITYPGGNAAAAAAARASNQYQFQLERASLVSAPVPQQWDLPRLTRQVALNNFYSGQGREGDHDVMKFLRDRIQHVIYIVKENRTYDQILGDLGNGSNGDPSLTVFGQSITPNFHKIAAQFVTLDNFMDPGDGSMDGWSWALAGRVTNTETITQQINYAFVNRGLSYESEGSNRNVPVGLTTTAARDTATGGAFSAGSANLPGGTVNVLVGPANHAVTDAPFGIQNGYVFDAALRAGKTVRNYGFLVNNIGRICASATDKPPCNASGPLADPFAAGIVQVAPLNPSLVPLTDVYFRGYDQNYPDLWRYNEWKREFDQFVANGNLPNLSLVRVSHDHMGAFASALAGVNTPETQQADNDLAVGKLVEAVANSPYAKNTLIIVTEDDCQDGPDHVDSHRATTYVVGAYVKQGAVIATHYSQVNALRTIEDVLGTRHINLNTAFQAPMADLFDVQSSGAWTYSAIASTVLKTTLLSIAQSATDVKFAAGPNIKPAHTAAYWAKVTSGMDFSVADHVPTARFNRVLWAGLMAGKPYPTIVNPSRSDGKDTDDDD
jgi:DNA-binding beta-propeller fold protein YncE